MQTVFLHFTVIGGMAKTKQVFDFQKFTKAVSSPHRSNLHHKNFLLHSSPDLPNIFHHTYLSFTPTKKSYFSKVT